MKIYVTLLVLFQSFDKLHTIGYGIQNECNVYICWKIMRRSVG